MRGWEGVEVEEEEEAQEEDEEDKDKEKSKQCLTMNIARVLNLHLYYETQSLT